MIVAWPGYHVDLVGDGWQLREETLQENGLLLSVSLLLFLMLMMMMVMLMLIQ